MMTSAKLNVWTPLFFFYLFSHKKNKFLQCNCIVLSCLYTPLWLFRFNSSSISWTSSTNIWNILKLIQWTVWKHWRTQWEGRASFVPEFWFSSKVSCFDSYPHWWRQSRLLYFRTNHWVHNKTVFYSNSPLPLPLSSLYPRSRQKLINCFCTFCWKKLGLSSM